jgi:hypothetical protein
MLPDEQVNPEDGLAEYEELEADGTITEIDSPDDEAPTTEDDEAADPSSRRNRAVERGQRTPQAAANLDDDPRFREWKAKKDREVAEERRQREALEMQMRQQQLQALEQQEQALARAVEEADDPGQQRYYTDQLAQLRAAKQYAALVEWDNYVRNRATEEGLNPFDFDPRRYSGPSGAAQFERELASAKHARVQAELAESKKAASPASIQKMIDEAVAKRLQAAGLNAVDMAQPVTPVNASGSWARDLALLQSGKMSGAEFKRRHGDK